MNYLILFLLAAIVSTMLIPLCMRVAPALGLLDKPNARKVHAELIPRVGGFGIFAGAMLAMLLGMRDMGPDVVAYLAGAAVLFVFGVWDDRADLGHRPKLVGQLIAAILVVYGGDLVVRHVPFLDGELPGVFAQPFTVFALVGAVNAVNHSDGLDGLAGGMSLAGLMAAAWLALAAEAIVPLLVVTAVAGGLVGFLRHNTWPARVFMGDAGSQFLGFTMAVLAVELTQRANPALSPAVGLFLLGLPLTDILVVLFKRLRAGAPWYEASRNHLHHRLLALGFHHYEAVTLLYLVQVVLAGLGVALAYEADALLVGVYVGSMVAVFGAVSLAERTGFRVHATGHTPWLARCIGLLPGHALIRELPARAVEAALAAFVLTGAFLARAVDRDVAWLALATLVLLALRLAFGYRLWFLVLRFLVFVALAIVLYAVAQDERLLALVPPYLPWLLFGGIAGAVLVSMRFGTERVFAATPLDWLVVVLLVALAAGWVPAGLGSGLGREAVALVVLFYGAELALKTMRRRINVFTVSLLVAMFAVGVRGVL